MQADKPPDLGVSRSRVLEALQAAAAPIGVDVLAERLRLHANTVRSHLDALTRAGLAERRTEAAARRGRPRVLYGLREPSEPSGHRDRRLLAEVLTGHIAATEDDPGRAALHAGREWGRRMAERSAARGDDGEQAVDRLVAVMTDVGFRPQPIASRRRIDLHHCPVGELARQHGEVVCAIHLGVVQGLLTALDAPVQAARATPFVNPDLCHVHLRTRRPSRRRHRFAGMD